MQPFSPSHLAQLDRHAERQVASDAFNQAHPEYRAPRDTSTPTLTARECEAMDDTLLEVA
jgi:hypothetical protein